MSGRDDGSLESFAKVMGEELGAVVHVLDHKLIELHVVWLQYRQIFGTDEETVHLVNRAAGLFFQVIQEQLWDGVLLGISKMTDPGATGKNQNLTINSLPSLIVDGNFKEKVETLCSAAVAEAAFAREHRNKRIAHRDHGHAVNVGANPLSGISRAKVEHMLASLREVLNAVHHHFRDTTVLYEGFIDYSGAELLVRRLEKLERLEREGANLG